MATTTAAVPTPVQRHYLAFLLSIACLVLIIASYQRDDHYWLYLGVALQALLLLHVCFRSRYLTGLGIAALVVYVLAIYPVLYSYIWPGADNIKRQVNLRDITQAFLKYDEVHKQLPRAAIVDKQNQALLSWRVELLPLLGHEALYEQFKLDEPWDSEHNIKLLPLIPQVYQPVGKRVPKGFTHTVVLRGPGSIFDEPKPVRVSQVSMADGLNMTVLLAETGRLIPWTKPEDEVVDPKLPVPWFKAYTVYGPGQSYCYLCFFDGRIVRLNNSYSSITNKPVKIDARKLHACVTWNGGEGGSPVSEAEGLEGP